MCGTQWNQSKTKYGMNYWELQPPLFLLIQNPYIVYGKEDQNLDIRHKLDQNIITIITSISIQNSMRQGSAVSPSPQLLSDSETSLLKIGHQTQDCSLTSHIKCLLHRCYVSGIKVTLMWISTHVSLPCNEWNCQYSCSGSITKLIIPISSRSLKYIYPGPLHQLVAI